VAAGLNCPWRKRPIASVAGGQPGSKILSCGEFSAGRFELERGDWGDDREPVMVMPPCEKLVKP